VVRKFFLLVFLILTASILISKPYVQLLFSGSGQMADVAKGYTLSSITDSERFYIYFSEAFKVVFKEVNFQDLFTSEDLLAGTFKDAEYRMVLNIKNFSIKTFKKRKIYLKDNENGDYILINGKFIKVYVGKWYKYDYSKGRYILNDEGRYVRSVDGKYYYYSGDFYRKLPVDEIWVEIKINASYVLYHGTEKKLSGDFKKDLKRRRVYYTYDGLNKHLIKHYDNEKLWTSEVAEELSKKVLSDLKKKFTIEAEVVKAKDMIVIIDKGKEEGIKPGMVFEGNGNIFMVREVTQDSAEAEVIKLSDVPLESVKELKENQNFKFPSFLHIGVGYSTFNGAYVSLGIRTIDLHWRERASGSSFISYDPFKGKINYGVDFRARVFGNFFIGFTSSIDNYCIYGGFSFFNLNPYVALSTNGVAFGGDLSW